MNRTWAKLTVSSLLLGTAAIGCTPDANMRPATLSSSGPKATRLAAQAAARASGALARHRPAVAVTFAEAAVEAAPRDAAYRALLGQSYLQAGRFASAGAALADAATLDPANAKAVLNLALAQAALGRQAAARATLRTVEGGIAPADLGLAMALCGDRAGAIRLLTASARTQGSGVRARQNLAFAYALDGQWRQARAIAAQDVSPQELDARMGEWAMLARPARSWDQIAAVLGVTPAADPGQPAMLALAPTAPEAAPIAVAVADPAPAPAPAAPVKVAQLAPVQLAPVQAAPVQSPLAKAEPIRAEPIQAPPVAVAEAAPLEAPATAFVAPEPAAPTPTDFVAPAPAASERPFARRVSLLQQHVHDFADSQDASGGRFVVQLGAFANADGPRAAWRQITRRFTMLASYSPSSVRFSANGATFTRLSIAGFDSRLKAVDVCLKIRSGRGACFVRGTAGDQLADWGKPGKGLALASR